MDYCLIGLITLSAVIGLFRGLIREVLSLIMWGAALWLGLQFNHS
ncbi:MAG: CvpA family protein, partial [Candidatus Methylumidiphilus sp.]